MAIAAFGQLFGDIGAFRSSHHVAPEAAGGLLVQGLVAPHIAPLQHGGTDGVVLPGHAHHLVDAAAGMADLQPQIPQKIQHRLDHLLAPRCVFAWCQEGDVNVRMGGHFATAIATHGHDGQPLAGRAVAHRIDGGGDMIVDHAQQLVDEEGLRSGAIVPGSGPLAQAAGDFLATMFQSGAQQLHHTGARVGGVAMGHGLGNGLAERAAVDYGALVGNADGRHRGAGLPWAFRGGCYTMAPTSKRGKSKM